VGIYKKGQTPGPDPSTIWSYVNTSGGNNLSSGNLTFSTTSLAANTEYFAAYMANNGYTPIAPSVPFYVGPTPTLSGASTVTSGSSATVSWTGAPGVVNADYIAIYQAGVTPGGSTPPVAKLYITGTSGSLTFSGLANGYYYAAYFVNNDTVSIGAPIKFAVGSNNATCTLPKQTFQYGENIPVAYANGPGNTKDYVGFWYADANISGSAPDDKLLNYLYSQPLGQATATVTLLCSPTAMTVTDPSSGSPVASQNLPAGTYQTGLFINDSYTSASPMATFTVTDPRSFICQPVKTGANTVQISWPSETGVIYTIQGSNDMVNWSTVDTVTGTSPTTAQYTITAGANVSTFYRVSQ
jgi:hypothetical protein